SADPTLARLAENPHRAALDRNSVKLGRSDQPIHSYLAQFRACPALAPVLAAQRDALSAALADRPEGQLPVLSATAPFRTGGHAGPSAYTDIPAGTLEMRHVNDLYPFPNTLIGLKIDGAEVLDWLERAASCFCQVLPHQRTQPLWDHAFAGHAFDTISGVTYRIDLTQPARYDALGCLRDKTARRIQDLAWNGTSLAPEQTFILATNSFRAFGGGPYRQTPEAQVIHKDERQIKSLLTEYLRDKGITESHLQEFGNTWSFLPIDGASVVLETGAGLRAYPRELHDLNAKDLGDAGEGFMRLELPL
ncbi:MAG: 5'-nucleotidase C-terminal domain-containing protein, partial [Pseudomonadota bacterium]